MVLSIFLSKDLAELAHVCNQGRVIQEGPDSAKLWSTPSGFSAWVASLKSLVITCFAESGPEFIWGRRTLISSKELYLLQGTVYKLVFKLKSISR